jgi:hypothetical protein
MKTLNELNNLSISELRELNKKTVEILRLKIQLEAKINSENLAVGMIVKYTGTSTKVKFNKFEVKKINRTKAECKCLMTNQIWTISLANLEASNESTVKEFSIVDKSEKQPNFRKQF